MRIQETLNNRPTFSYGRHPSPSCQVYLQTSLLVSVTINTGARFEITNQRYATGNGI